MNVAELTKEERQHNVRTSIDKAKDAIANQTNTHPSNWLTAEEASALLGVSRPTLLSGRKMGKYRYVQHNGTRVYYDKRSLLQYLTPSEGDASPTQ